MTIDEAIKQFKYDAECNRADLDLSYAEDNEQIAKWLEELKAYRENSNGYNKEDIELNRNAMYNKAIDNFKSRLEERILAGKMIDEKFAYIDNCDIDEIAEQLKAGGKNEQSI